MLNNSQYINKLRSSGLRPTKQRIKICEILFNTQKTFHFTINDLVEKISKSANDKISLATVYNTVHAFKKKGYLKEIPINSDQSYFDTNTSHHHHFYDESQKDLIDIDDADVEPVKINTKIPGKKITSVEVLVKVEDIKS
jgi:Fur family iron response transcriptional regulator|tara:strand:- start:98 stop:517 length:420 start_codon:yes stop_codon:yes gene_type:complete